MYIMSNRTVKLQLTSLTSSLTDNLKKMQHSRHSQYVFLVFRLGYCTGLHFIVYGFLVYDPYFLKMLVLSLLSDFLILELFFFYLHVPQKYTIDSA